MATPDGNSLPWESEVYCSILLRIPHPDRKCCYDNSPIQGHEQPVDLLFWLPLHVRASTWCQYIYSPIHKSLMSNNLMYLPSHVTCPLTSLRLWLHYFSAGAILPPLHIGTYSKVFEASWAHRSAKPKIATTLQQMVSHKHKTNKQKHTPQPET